MRRRPWKGPKVPLFTLGVGMATVSFLCALKKRCSMGALQMCLAESLLCVVGGCTSTDRHTLTQTSQSLPPYTSTHLSKAGPQAAWCVGGKGWNIHPFGCHHQSAYCKHKTWSSVSRREVIADDNTQEKGVAKWVRRCMFAVLY